jgi:BON domain
MQEHSRRGAEASKRLLARRMGEETDGRELGIQREGGRGAYGMERGPYSSAYGYRATSYRATGRWQPEDEWGFSGSLESRPTGAFVGRGPKSYTQSRERIVDRVSERLTDHPDLDASEIQVDVQDGVVVLQGKVRDRGQKRMAEDVAESVSGVRDVRNELDVDKGLFQELTDAITGRSDEPADKRAREQSSV